MKRRVFCAAVAALFAPAAAAVVDTDDYYGDGIVTALAGANAGDIRHIRRMWRDGVMVWQEEIPWQSRRLVFRRRHLGEPEEGSSDDPTRAVISEWAGRNSDLPINVNDRSRIDLRACLSIPRRHSTAILVSPQP